VRHNTRFWLFETWCSLDMLCLANHETALYQLIGLLNSFTTDPVKVLHFAILV